LSRHLGGPILEVSGMELSEVLAGTEGQGIESSAGLEVLSVACDSREVAPGALFFALHGEKADGHQYINEAISRGAIGIVSEHPSPGRPSGRDFGSQILPRETVWIQVPRARRALAIAAANFYRRPATALTLAAVTGTNGKTTTVYLIDSILRAAGHATGLFGTVAYRTPAGVHAAKNTTPESLDFQRMLGEVRDAGGTHAVLEASSHALSLDRLWGCHFAVAVFTNLTRDHLDYHETLEKYFAAKRTLFEGTGAGAPDTAVINADDPLAVQLEGLAARAIRFGLKNSPPVTAGKISYSFSGLNFIAHTPEGKIEVHSRLVARINVYNILAAIAAAQALGIPNEAIELGIAQLESVPGRFERVDAGQPFLVVVDYAHTHDAITNLIQTARELNPNGRILIVFGAGGDRDRTKRPLMGEAAGRLSDRVILTSDNPRSEDPLRILNDVTVGLQRAGANYAVELDRERAIERVMEEARAGDIVLLAGKGHENYQVLKDRTLDFDDRQVARRVLAARGYRPPA
jgi:UDP-N-acetylmuramoyl-L-alanyl-D-glutamate--2,6-diaminopimelate ligase